MSLNHEKRKKKREKEIMIIDYIRKGATSKEIASALNLATKTVETHRHNILKKLKLKNSTALVNMICHIDGFADNFTSQT